MLDETHPPLVAERIEERSKIDIENPVHLRTADPHGQRVQRIVLAAPGSKALREPQEVLLVDRVEHLHQRPLEDLVLQRATPKGRSRPSSFGMNLRREGSAR